MQSVHEYLRLIPVFLPPFCAGVVGNEAVSCVSDDDQHVIERTFAAKERVFERATKGRNDNGIPRDKFAFETLGRHIRKLTEMISVEALCDCPQLSNAHIVGVAMRPFPGHHLLYLRFRIDHAERCTRKEVMHHDERHLFTCFLVELIPDGKG